MGAIRRWMCTSSTKNMLVKIVHPGGHVELHDRPLPASEVMSRNPRSIVAHPHVFREPWTAVVKPDTMLLPGQKFYVVPVSTVRKLQRKSFNQRCSPSSRPSSPSSPSPEPESNSSSSNSNISQPKATGHEGEAKGSGGVGSKSKKKGNCFVCLLKIGDKLSEVDLVSLFGSSESGKKKAAGDQNYKGDGGCVGTPKESPCDVKGFSSLENNWQPRLESIHEELSV